MKQFSVIFGLAIILIVNTGWISGTSVRNEAISSSRTNISASMKGNLQVVLIDHFSNPVAGATLTVVGHTSNNTVSGTTDALGVCNLSVPGNEEYDITASWNGQSASATDYVEDNTFETVVLTLN